MHAELPLRVVDAFFGNVCFESDIAEDINHEVFKEQNMQPAEQLRLLSDMFEPIFIYYPNGLNDRNVAQARDAAEYIKAWRELALFRRTITTVAEHWSPEDEGHLTTRQRQSVFQAYLSDFRDNRMRANQKWNKSSAEARLNRIAGSRLAAFVIWEIGIPNIQPVPATEQLAEKRDLWKAGTTHILLWLTVVAQAIFKYKEMGDYQEAVRRGGQKKHVSGLTQEELRARACWQKALWRRAHGARLARQYEAGTITYYSMSWYDWSLLQDVWAGRLNAEVDNARLNHCPPQHRMSLLVTD